MFICICFNYSVVSVCDKVKATVNDSVKVRSKQIKLLYYLILVY